MEALEKLLFQKNYISILDTPDYFEDNVESKPHTQMSVQ